MFTEEPIENSNLFVGETNLRGIVKSGPVHQPQHKKQASERRIEDQREEAYYRPERSKHHHPQP